MIHEKVYAQYYLFGIVQRIDAYNVLFLISLIYINMSQNLLLKHLRAMCCRAYRERVCAVLYAELQVYRNSNTFHGRGL